MANVTLTASGYTFTFQQSDIDKIEEDVGSEIDHLPLPLSGPASAFGYDFSGVTKRITVIGAITEATTTRVTGYTITSILQQKQWLESLQTGNQSAAVFGSTYAAQTADTSTGATAPYLMHFSSSEGFIENIKFTEESANPHQLPFEMKIIIGQ